MKQVDTAKDLFGSGLFASDNFMPYLRIAELGFGTGLNFLLSVQAFQAECAHRKQSGKLHYYAITKHPLKCDELQEFYETMPKIQSEIQSDFAWLQQALPKTVSPKTLPSGLTHLSFPDNNIALSLLIGDVAEMLPLLPTGLNGWFLDDFAPYKNYGKNYGKNSDKNSDKNPDAEELFSLMAQKSRDGAIVVSSTATADIAKNLANHRFFPDKKENSTNAKDYFQARYHPSVSYSRHRRLSKNHYYHDEKPTLTGQKIAVIGGGIAGLMAGFHLQQHGAIISLIEAKKIGAGASGNQVALVEPHVGSAHHPDTQIYRQAFQEARKFYTDLQNQNVPAILAQGIKKQPVRAGDAERFTQLLHDFPDIWRQDGDGVICDDALVINAPVILSWLATQISEHGNLFEGQKVTGYQLQDDGVLLTVADGEIPTIFDKILFANAIAVQELLPKKLLNELPFLMTKGQIIEMQGDESCFPETTDSHSHFITPLLANNIAFAGSDFEDISYQQACLPPEATSKVDAKIRDAILSLLPNDDAIKHAFVSGNRASYRLRMRDYLPLLGGFAPDNLSALHQKKAGLLLRDYDTTHRLYMMVGLGARGWTSSPLLAMMLGAMMQGEIMPMAEKMHPLRFHRMLLG